MNENHAIQRDLGGSGESNERLIAAALDAGALGAKLAGAGDGGTIIALWPGEDTTPLEEALREAGASAIYRPEVTPGATIEVDEETEVRGRDAERRAWEGKGAPIGVRTSRPHERYRTNAGSLHLRTLFRRRQAGAGHGGQHRPRPGYGRGLERGRRPGSHCGALRTGPGHGSRDRMPFPCR